MGADVNANLYLGETKYGSMPSSCVAKEERSSPNEDVKDPLLNGAADVVSAVENLDVQLKSVLVPVRDPVTKKIKHKLVPVESKDETGLNIIKSVLIPCKDVYGSECYEVRQVFVPIRPEPTLMRNSSRKIRSKQQGKAGENRTKRPANQEDVMLDVRNMCRICQIVYDTQQSLDTHVRRVHEKPYRCLHCHDAFMSKRAYKEHMKTHKTKTPVGCPFCQQRFKRMFGLRQHQIRVHSTIEPKFVCDHCGKRFKLKSDMSLHIDKSHMKNPVRVYKFSCQLCANKFRFRNEFENHLRTHKKKVFECDKCKRVFSKACSLALHKYAKHKPAMCCTICEKSYKYRNSFYRHVLTHAGMGPYHCDVCNTDFEKRTCFINHRKTHPTPRHGRSASIIAEMVQRILQNN
ncbi:zinc finger and BTB domain-containing protein 41 [Megalopta genalis]|uniref:zinc finger and BTB domain-containing protein 41 n=1 Tax=Megalopta genalis TaxID=115081 RepID=UPI003FD07D86